MIEQISKMDTLDDQEMGDGWHMKEESEEIYQIVEDSIEFIRSGEANEYLN